VEQIVPTEIKSPETWTIGLALDFVRTADHCNIKDTNADVGPSIAQVPTMSISNTARCAVVNGSDTGEHHDYASSTLNQRCLVSIEHHKQEGNTEVTALNDTVRATKRSNADNFVDVCSAVVRHFDHCVVAQCRKNELASQHVEE